MSVFKKKKGKKIQILSKLVENISNVDDTYAHFLALDVGYGVSKSMKTVFDVISSLALQCIVVGSFSVRLQIKIENHN